MQNPNGPQLLCKAPLTGALWSATAAFAFHVLARVEDQVGFLPAAATRLDRLRNLEGQGRTEYLSATAYHTVFVMGLLCATALHKGCEPPAKIPTNAAVSQSADAFLPFLDRAHARKHWQDAFDRLTSSERDALAGLIFTIALHRCIASHDFARVAQLLDMAVVLNLADNAAASQAAELLDRLSLLSRPEPCGSHADSSPAQQSSRI